MADPKEKATALAPSEFNVNDHHLLQHGKMLITFGVMSILYVGADISGKTSGWIQSDAEPGVRKTSISGWKRLQGILDSEVYTAMVKTTADEIGFSLPGDPRDNNLKEALPHQVGRCQACHIEKKLGLWWVYRVLRSLLKTKDISRMGELRGIKLPPRMACATVFLNHKPCQPCLDFLDEINRITGIAITTREIPYIAVTDRPKVAAYPKGDDAEDKSYDQAEDENYDQDAEGELPETPRPVAPRKSSDPKVTKTLILSSPPKPWSRYANGGAKPPTTRMTLQEQRQMFGGSPMPHQDTAINQPGEVESHLHHRASRAADQSIESGDQERDVTGPETSSPAQAHTYTTPPPRSGLNLQRYAYGGGIVTPSQRPRKAEPKKSKGVTRAEKARKKSTFLRAVERADKQRASGQGHPAQDTDGGVGNNEDDVSLVPVHPDFLANHGRDVVMG